MSSEIDSFLAALPGRVGGKDLSGIRATYVFEIEGGEAWTVRIEDEKVAVANGDDAGADCTISATEETFTKLFRGELAAVPAYLGGKLRLSGDLNAAMQLQKLL
ncbi:MAG: SCP2 sterol-binding domain-containing protein [Gaiellaceae bacterium]|jgi:putative sterol carrier protein